MRMKPIHHSSRYASAKNQSMLEVNVEVRMGDQTWSNTFRQASNPFSIIYSPSIPFSTKQSPSRSLSNPRSSHTNLRHAQSSPKLSLTPLLHLRLNSFASFPPTFSSLHSLAASTFAGLSSFGLCSKLITLNSIVSGV